jgi:deazaflavin-dependent oxidoreductase (nitroreductase family)
MVLEALGLVGRASLFDAGMPGTGCHALSKQYGWGMSLALRCQPGQQKDGPMSFQKTPGGTRGARVPPSNAVTRALNRVAMSWHRRSGDRFQGQDLLYLTTVGAKTGQKRQTAVARFPDGEDAWLVVASAGGSARHPAWYHNIAAHPDQVWVEFGGRQLRVTPTQLDGDARAQAWQRITQLQPRYAGYERKTDRAIPVIRLSRAD